MAPRLSRSQQIIFAEALRGQSSAGPAPYADYQVQRRAMSEKDNLQILSA
jgi:hypothetical protein